MSKVYPLILTCLLFSYSVAAQNLSRSLPLVSINAKEISLTELISQVKAQTGLNVVYNNSLLDQQKKISLKLHKLPVEEVMKRALLFTNLSFSIENNTLYIIPGKHNGSNKLGYFNNLQTITGTLYDTEGNPLPSGRVTSMEFNQSVFTNPDGTFKINIEKKQWAGVTLQFSYIGKQSKTMLVQPDSTYQNLKITLSENSLYLTEVEVNANRAMTGNSNSSIFFNREAIELTQALSLSDVLNLLPGKSVNAPNLTNPNILTLRSVAGDSWANNVFSRNNAFGITYVMDGVQMSNDANMQSLNPGAKGFGSPYIQGEYGLGLNNRNTTTGDNAYSGIDMRQIAVDNIESIEVVSGVASAKYGDYTDGAIIINRQAGKSPLSARLSLRNGTTQYSLSKGFLLDKNQGGLNVDFNYLRVNNDPRDNLKAYNRVSGRIMHTLNFGKQKQYRNTLSIGGSANLDGTKLDIDDRAERKAIFEYTNFNFTNRLSYTFKESSSFKKAEWSAGLTAGRQYSSMQYKVAGESFPYVSGSNEGLNVGDYANGYYLGKTIVEGKPVTANTNFNLSANYRTGKIPHQLNVGGNIYYSANFGRGQIIDPEQPLFSTGNERSYNYNELKGILNYGAYIEDNFIVPLFNRDLNFRTGLRIDQQGGAVNLSPRINTNYRVNDKMTFGASYGMATKAAGLAHRYPGPVYSNTPLIRANNEDPDKRLYLVYTNIIRPDNNDLKPQKSKTFELSFNYNEGRTNFSVSYYNKKTSDGFSTKSMIKELSIPNYTYYIDEKGKAAYKATGGISKKPVSYSQIINSQNTSNNGIEFMLSTPKIRAIATSFNISAGYTNSYFYDTAPQMNILNLERTDFNQEAVFAVFPPENRRNIQWRTSLSSSTHIPALGLMVNLIGDLPVKTKSIYYKRSADPIGYYDALFNYHPIDNYDPGNPIYGHLATLTESKYKENERHPIFYGNLHLRLSKDVAKKLRFSFNVYNMLNWRPSYIVASSENKVVLNEAPSFGAEISLKL